MPWRTEHVAFLSLSVLWDCAHGENSNIFSNVLKDLALPIRNGRIKSVNVPWFVQKHAKHYL